MTRRIRPLSGQLVDQGLDRMAPGGQMWSESPVYSPQVVTVSVPADTAVPMVAPLPDDASSAAT